MFLGLVNILLQRIRVPSERVLPPGPRILRHILCTNLNGSTTDNVLLKDIQIHVLRKTNPAPKVFNIRLSRVSHN